MFVQIRAPDGARHLIRKNIIRTVQLGEGPTEQGETAFGFSLELDDDENVTVGYPTKEERDNQFEALCKKLCA